MNGPANVLLCGGTGGGETFDHHICASLRREVAQFQIAVAGQSTVLPTCGSSGALTGLCGLASRTRVEVSFFGLACDRRRRCYDVTQPGR